MGSRWPMYNVTWYRESLILQLKNTIATKYEWIMIISHYPTYRQDHTMLLTQIAKFMEPTWGPPGSCRPQMGLMLAPPNLAIRVAMFLYCGCWLPGTNSAVLPFRSLATKFFTNWLTSQGIAKFCSLSVFNPDQRAILSSLFVKCSIWYPSNKTI